MADLLPLTPEKFEELKKGLVKQDWGNALSALEQYYENRRPPGSPTWHKILQDAGGPTATQWTPLVNGIQNVVKDTSEQGACVYPIDNGFCCAVMTQEQCTTLHGHWQQGASCPPGTQC
jgi:hypothetical protein